MIEHYYAVIMAGGGGTRLWPLSRQHLPKQMLRLVGDRTLFQVAVDRLETVFPPERILVVTVADQAKELMKQVPLIPAENYLIEPMPRGTASVVGFAATVLHKRDPQAVMAVLTADHFIENVNLFRQLFRAAYELAQQDYLVTLGIHPTFPSTGYGYIQRGEKLSDGSEISAFHVLKFKEKPGEDAAREFLASGDHDWNSGMFFWKTKRILAEFSELMPELSDTLGQIQLAWGTEFQDRTIENLWQSIRPNTIDYGIMEKARQVVVIPAIGLGWNDVGSWESLFEVLEADENGNIILNANFHGWDTINSLICSEQNHRLITTIGVQNLIIVDTGNALLVCQREQAQQVRQVVEWLKKTNQNQYV